MDDLAVFSLPLPPVFGGSGVVVCVSFCVCAGVGVRGG